MSREEEILKIGKKLDKATSNGSGVSDSNILDLLKNLKSYDMNLEILQKTRIGMKVNSVRKKSSNEEIVSLAKALVKGWKKLLDEKDPKTPSKTASQRSNGESVSDNNSQSRTDSAMTDNNEDSRDADMGGGDAAGATSPSPPSGEAGSPPPQPPTPQAPKRTESVDSVGSAANGGLPAVAATSDEMRLKYRSMLIEALRTDGSEVDEDYLANLAARIEDSAKQLHKTQDKKYLACLRSRIFNLKDKKNPDLRSNVILGMISPERLTTMTPEEMASKSLREKRAQMTKKAIEEHQLAQDTGTETNLFTCGKCKGKRCTYTQAQTRSADEPMTTFVLCTQCGNRWKFC